MRNTTHWLKEFVEIPAWAIGKEQDLASVITAIALAGFEGQWIRLSAATQRALMGKAYFGKRHVHATASKIVVSRKVAYGQDFDSTTLDSDGWRDMVNRGYLL